MIEELFSRYVGAFSENTLRAYRSDFKQYQAWCATRKQPSLPATPTLLADYVDYLVTKNRSATIRRKINSLGTIFRLSKHPDPTKEAEVILALKRMHRRLGRRQKQAEPLTRDLFEVLLSSCTDDRKGIRNRILLRIGYETMRRRSELCKFKFENLQHSHRSQPMLFLETSKTDQEASGQIIPISRDLEQLINFWRLTLEADPKSFILRSIDKHGNVGQSRAPVQFL
jgi:site-specific recombinase XerD